MELSSSCLKQSPKDSENKNNSNNSSNENNNNNNNNSSLTSTPTHLIDNGRPVSLLSNKNNDSRSYSGDDIIHCSSGADSDNHTGSSNDFSILSTHCDSPFNITTSISSLIDLSTPPISSNTELQSSTHSPHLIESSSTNSHSNEDISKTKIASTSVVNTINTTSRLIADYFNPSFSSSSTGLHLSSLTRFFNCDPTFLIFYPFAKIKYSTIYLLQSSLGRVFLTFIIYPFFSGFIAAITQRFKSHIFHWRHK